MILWNSGDFYFVHSGCFYLDEINGHSSLGHEPSSEYNVNNRAPAYACKLCKNSCLFKFRTYKTFLIISDIRTWMSPIWISIHHGEFLIPDIRYKFLINTRNLPLIFWYHEKVMNCNTRNYFLISKFWFSDIRKYSPIPRMHEPVTIYLRATNH